MKRYVLPVAGLMVGVGLWAQALPPFQFFSISGGGRTLTQDSLPIPSSEKGKPFSATATSQTHETLIDGTQVNLSASMLEYRDAEGRVRTENIRTNSSSANGRGANGAGSGGSNAITIRDSVAGVAYTLDTARKTAVRFSPGGRALTMDLPIVAVPFGGSGRGFGRGGRGGSGGASPTSPEAAQYMARVAGQANGQIVQIPVLEGNASGNFIVQNLGTMTLNGVPVIGTRTTTIVPVGAIGNDREFQSVSERWFSSELNLLVKSVSTDPRFGTTTYELTNISRMPPDPSLFQIPAEYTFR